MHNIFLKAKQIVNPKYTWHRGLQIMDCNTLIHANKTVPTTDTTRHVLFAH